MTAFGQPTGDPRRTVRLTAVLMGLGDQGQQRQVGLRSWSGLATDPGMITAAGHVQGLAQLIDGIISLHRFYPLEPPSDGSEIMPKVFFKMSRCCVIRCSSFCNRRFSA